MSNIYNAIQNLYNMDKTTWQEVLAELYNLVSNVENKFDLFENKFGLLLGKEVTRELKKMYDDGSLSSLINDKLLKDINTIVDGFKTEVNEQLDTIVKNSNEVSVANFGAVGDGITDDTNSFLNAINYCLTNKKVLLIPSGVFLVNLELTNCNGLYIKGTGYNDTVLKSISNKPTLKIFGETLSSRVIWVKLENFRIDGAGKSTCLELVKCQNFTLTDVRLQNGKQGINCIDVWDTDVYSMNIVKCSDELNNRYALTLTSDEDCCNAMKFFGLRIEHCGLFINSLKTRHTYFTNCKFEQAKENNNYNPFIFQDTREISFINCMFVASKETFTNEAYVNGNSNLHFIKASTSEAKNSSYLKFTNCNFIGAGLAMQVWYIGECTTFTNCDFIRAYGGAYTCFNCQGYVKFKNCSIVAYGGGKIFAIANKFNDIEIDCVLNTVSPAFLILSSTALNNNFLYCITNTELSSDWLKDDGNVKANNNIKERY